jgi:hypothetical protein
MLIIQFAPQSLTLVIKHTRASLTFQIYFIFIFILDITNAIPITISSRFRIA